MSDTLNLNFEGTIMSTRLIRTDIPWTSQTVLTQLTVVGLLSLFWVSLGLNSGGTLVTGMRVGTSLVLLLIVPGALLGRLARIETNRLGEFVLYSVGLSLSFLSLFAFSLSILSPVVGISKPFSVQPLAISLTIVLLVMGALLWFGEHAPLRFQSLRVSPVAISFVLLPVVSIVAATVMNSFGNASFMFILVFLVVAAVLVTSTRYFSPRQYPMAIFFIALATFLHRNLLTSGVIGADVQFQYFLALRIHELGVWSPGVGSRIMALPMVTSVPATFSILTGISVATVFKTIYVFVFSLVPVGIYYVGKDIFGRREAFFGSLFFVFYHTSFYLTPGKQLLSELFIVLLLLLFFKTGLSTVGTKAVAVLLTAAVIHTHYGLTFVFGSSLLVGYVLLSAIRVFVDDFDHDISIVYPITFLGFAIAWYWMFTPDLLSQILRTPFIVVQQTANLVTGTAVGSGANYIQEQVGLLDQLNVVAYLLLTALLGLGIMARIVVHGGQLRRGESATYIEYTAIAVPMFVFLASTFLVTANLWADRSYQMVLVVLGPFVALGFSFLFDAAMALFDRIDRPRSLRPRWSVLAVLLCILFLLNSGAAYAAVGDADTATFDSEANDYAFTTEERAGAQWLKDNTGLTGPGTYRDVGVTEPTEKTVTIYTDSVSYQMFRSTLPVNYYDVQVVRLRSPWQPEFEQDRLGSGYVFIRKRSIEDAPASGVLPITSLSREHANEIIESGTVVFENEDVIIVGIGDRAGT